MLCSTIYKFSTTRASLCLAVPSYHQSRFLAQKNNMDDYCLNSVRKYDHENFVASLLLPTSCRFDVLALRAFNIELAQVGMLTREPLAGLMRLEFWRETLDKVYSGQPPQQPVAQRLHMAVTKHKLSRRWLRKLLESRERQIKKSGFTTVAELETYAEESNAALYYLILQTTGVCSVSADHCASHLGQAEGLLKVLRGLPAMAVRGHLLLPRQLMAEHGVSDESLVRGVHDDQALQDAVFVLATLANQHLTKALSISRDLPREALTALLPAVAVGAALRQLQTHNFNVFHPNWSKRNAWLPVQLLWAKVTNSL